MYTKALAAAAVAPNAKNVDSDRLENIAPLSTDEHSTPEEKEQMEFENPLQKRRPYIKLTRKSKPYTVVEKTEK